jgi:hypothetical protein
VPSATGSGRALLVVRVAARPIAPLVAGRPGAVELTITIGAPALGVPEQNVPVPVPLGTGPLRLDALLPAEVRLGDGPAGSGWTCAGTACHGAALGLGGTSKALLALELGPGARGGLGFRISGPGILTASVTLDEAIRAAGER